MQIRLHANDESYELVWANSVRLEELWDTDDPYYVAFWKGEPNRGWFRPKGTRDFFLAPVLTLGSEKIEPPVSIPEGRHRTRWLISNVGCEEIPVGMHERKIDIAISIGLVARFVEEGDEIQLPSTQSLIFLRSEQTDGTWQFPWDGNDENRNW